LNNNPYRGSVRNTVRGFLLLLWPSIFFAFVRLALSFLVNYLYVELTTSLRKLYVINAPVDERIPFDPGAILPYFGFMVSFIGLLGYLHKSMGNAIIPELKKFIWDIGSLYEDAAQIYRTAPTVFHRKGTSVATIILRLFDSERNSAPSMHVAFAGLIFLRGSEISQLHRLEARHMTRENLLKLATRVIDSTLLIKQHSIRDVATGLVLLRRRGYRDKDQIRSLINGIFEYSNTAASPEVKRELKAEIESLYDRLAQNEDTLGSIISYIQTLPRQ
jgi:membrane-associated phospholipid phosphatase